MKFNKRLIIIFTGLVIIAFLGQKFLVIKSQHERVDASGKVSFTFNGLPPNAPVFTAGDVKPGDCYDRDVVAYNSGTSTQKISVKANKTFNPDHFDKVFSLAIKADDLEVYQGQLSKFLKNDTILGVIKPKTSKIFHFRICLPSTVGNRYQEAKLIFDLLFSAAYYSCPSRPINLIQTNDLTMVSTISATQNIGSQNFTVTNQGGENQFNQDVNQTCFK